MKPEDAFIHEHRTVHLESSFHIGRTLGPWNEIDTAHFAGRLLRAVLLDLQRIFEITPEADEFLVNGVRVSIDHYELDYGDEVRIVHAPKPVTVPVSNAVPHVAILPRWDRECDTLFFGATIIKRFGSRAKNQTAILDAFEEEGWPLRIDDPLRPNPELVPTVRLYRTVENLNDRHVTPGLLRFHVEGDGEKVSWERLPP